MEITDWPDYMPPRESWAEPFWGGLTDGKLMLPHCSQCKSYHYPPIEERCPKCTKPFSWVESSGAARLWSWTTFHHGYFQNYPLGLPYTVLMVELDVSVKILASLSTGESMSELKCDMEMAFQSMEIQSGVFIPAFSPV